MKPSSINTGSRMIEPAEQVTDNVIYLLHPSEPRMLKLLRGTDLEKTLRQHGYSEITKEEYELGVICR